MPLNALDALGVILLSRGSKKVSKKGEVKLTLRVLFGAVLAPWGHLGSILELPDLKNNGFAGDSFLDHFFVSNPGTLKCAQERSRCSLSTIFAFSASLEKCEKWSQK